MARSVQPIRGAQPAAVRCAIYTRKSTEEGLEQEFNSLDAQREACAAYILSQRHEGWALAPGSYDDGGFSGGSLERPGLQRLLADVAAGKIDVIVVYKVDRLTRSLTDFSKIVEVLETAGASFVSVTQAFNTTTSMGRLMLNVLLSFAQFEREVTGERIRDKVAASKKKGMWMGGVVPLGYRVEARKLVIDAAEAEAVHTIFATYLQVGSVAALKAELDAGPIRTRPRVSRNGRSYGGLPFTTGALYSLLRNRLYVGEVHHKGSHYAGEHDAILDTAMFETVQARLDAKRNGHANGEHADQPSLLAGLLYDAHGRRMSPSHAVKQAKRYRYYVSRPEACEDGGDHPIWRMPAGDLEKIVTGKLIQHLKSPNSNRSALSPDTAATDLAAMLAAAASAAEALQSEGQSARRAALLELVDRITVGRDEIRIDLVGSATTLITRSTNVRVGKEMRLALDGPDAAHMTFRDPALIKLIVRAHQARAAMAESAAADLNEAATEQGLTANYLARLIRLSYLAPDITSAILDGRQPPTLTRQGLARLGDLPLRWDAQRHLLGFA